MELKKLSRKGQVNAMGPAIIALVIAGVFLILGMVMLQNVRDTDIVRGDNFVDCNSTGLQGCTQAYQDANTTIIGIATFADFWEIIVLAIVITIVIGLLLVVFGGRGNR